MPYILNPPKPKRPDDKWSHGLLDCADEGCSCSCCLQFVLIPQTYGEIVQTIPATDEGCNTPVCCAGQFCLPCIQSCINDVVGTVFPPLGVLGACIHLQTRAHLMEKYRIGHPEKHNARICDCEEFLVVFCCKFCATYQEWREIKRRNPVGGQQFSNINQPPAAQFTSR